jgi:hypothetical protein
MSKTLNDLMEMDHVVRVAEDGTITDGIPNVWAPEICINTDADGQISRDDERDMIEQVAREGWTLLTGWTGQYLAGNSPIMHASEYIGGALEQHIRETPGLYAAVAVETLDDDDDPAGWVLAYREN